MSNDKNSASGAKDAASDAHAVHSHEGPSHFVRDLIRDDLSSGRVEAVVTRFPPEPNGYLHIGHAKSICLNFGMAAEFGGRCNFRFDDTNPVKEDEEYIDAIEEDLKWMGFDWAKTLYASDYFEQLYEWAEHLIVAGKAYVDDLSADEIRAYRGTLTSPGKDSPHRGRSIDENLDLFRRMRAGEFVTARKYCAPRSICRRATSIYAIRSSIVCCAPRIHAQARPGVSIRPMTSPMASPMPLKASRIHCARWNLLTIAPCTIG